MNVVMKSTHERTNSADELLYKFCTGMCSDDISKSQRPHRDLSRIQERTKDGELRNCSTL